MNYLFKNLLIVITAGILFSCSEGEKAKRIPDGVLTKEQFAKVLADLALAESASNLNVKNVKIEKTDSAYAFNAFTENSTTIEQYKKSAEFYAANPELYAQAYDEAMRILTEMQVKRDGIRKDSIR